MISKTIKGIRLSRREGEHPLPESNRYNYSLKPDEDDCNRIELLKKIQKDHVYRSREVKATDCEGAKIIEYVFQGISGYYADDRSAILVKHDIVREDRDAWIAAAEGDQQKRLICDHVAGMTDAHINKIFHALLRIE